MKSFDVRLGLLAGQQLLARVFDTDGIMLGVISVPGLGVRERRLGREEDLLLRQLVAHVGADEAVAPGQQAARPEQHDDGHEASGAGENVKYLA